MKLKQPLGSYHEPITIKKFDKQDMEYYQDLFLQDEEIHVWIVRWRQIVSWLITNWQLMSAEEKNYVERFRLYEDRMRGAAGKILTRTLLAQYMNIPIHDICINAGYYGKPYLEKVTTDRSVQYSVSHSGEIVLLVFGKFPVVHGKTRVEQFLVEIWIKAFGRETIGITDNYFELGGDSLLGTRICAEIHRELGIDLTLRSLFEKTSIAELAKYVQELLDKKTNGAFSGIQLPAITPEPARRYEPFPLTGIQLAYWVGRSGAYTLGNVSSHCYFELEQTGLDMGRVNRAWQRLIDQHDMLRAIILPDGQQQKILDKVPFYPIEIFDLRMEKDGKVFASLEAIKNEMSHQILSVDEWPLFEIKASILASYKL